VGKRGGEQKDTAKSGRKTGTSRIEWGKKGRVSEKWRMYLANKRETQRNETRSTDKKKTFGFCPILMSFRYLTKLKIRKKHALLIYALMQTQRMKRLPCKTNLTFISKKYRWKHQMYEKLYSTFHNKFCGIEGIL